MTRTTTLATAIRRKDWERAALLLLIGALEAVRDAPPGTIDDVLMLLSADGDEEPPRAPRAQRGSFDERSR
ncbi:MAG: hypothetical protein EPO22_05670 [Dehalococcoidia bacterium]|nr:MAG: hypothetical protein EPO22_05670 [Dehalococcoidia bacterium]